MPVVIPGGTLEVVPVTTAITGPSGGHVLVMRILMPVRLATSAVRVSTAAAVVPCGANTVARFRSSAEADCSTTNTAS